MGVPILDEILEFMHKLVDWFIATLPSWAKILVGMFFVMFLANFIVPLLLGFFYGCTTTGYLYELESPFVGIEVMTYKLFNDLDAESAKDYTDVINRTEEDKSYLDWVIRFLPCYFGSTKPQCAEGAFDYWRYQYPTNYSNQTVANYNAFVTYRGTYISGAAVSNQVIGAKCDGVSARLYLFNRVDIFDPQLWLIITIASFLIPFAFKWYQMTGVS